MSVCRGTPGHSGIHATALEASVVAVRRPVVHWHVHHVHVVLMKVEGTGVVVVVVMVVVVGVVVVVVIVQRGQVLQRGHVGGRAQPWHDHLGVVRRWRRWVAGTRRDEKGSLHCLGERSGRGVGNGWVFCGWTDTGPLGVCDGLRWRTDSLP